MLRLNDFASNLWYSSICIIHLRAAESNQCYSDRKCHAITKTQKNISSNWFLVKWFCKKSAIYLLALTVCSINYDRTWNKNQSCNKTKRNLTIASFSIEQFCTTAPINVYLRTIAFYHSTSVSEKIMPEEETSSNLAIFI